MSIQYPWALTLVFFIPIVIYIRKKYIVRIGFTQLRFFDQSLQAKPLMKYFPDIFATIFMLLVVFAIANIQYSSYWHKTYLETKWIMLVQDLSGSMQRLSSEGDRSTLGDVALEGARAFIDLRQKDDLIGIIAFSSFAKLVAPPTFDKDILKKKLTLLSRREDSFIFRELTVGGATNASYATWLALCVFFMLLPEEHQPSLEEINDLRDSLMGRTVQEITVPQKLKNINFGQGMAIVLFTDGRIEVNISDSGGEKGLLNFINVIKLIKALGIKIYFIVVGEELNREIRFVLENEGTKTSAGEIFYMPYIFDREKIIAVYQKINEIERNRLLEKISKQKKGTREPLALSALIVLIGYWLIQISPRFRKV